MVNLINILLLSAKIPKVQKDTYNLTKFLTLFGSAHVKALSKMLVISTPDPCTPGEHQRPPASRDNGLTQLHVRHPRALTHHRSQSEDESFCKRLYFEKN